jgi:methionyl-tRNA formyltransferase
MRVLFFGTPSFAAPTLDALVRSRHQVVGVVTQPDRASGRGQRIVFSPVKTLARENGVHVFQPRKLLDPDLLRDLLIADPEIGVVAAYGKLLPQAMLDIPVRGLINVHASLLPRWRGAAPIHRAIQAGDAVTGVTIMRVVLALDAGPMLSRVEVPIDPNITSDALEQVLAQKGAELLVETLEHIEHGTSREVEQDESGVTYAKKLERADGHIDWRRSATELHNLIRGLHPWPLASALLRGRRVIVRRSRVASALSTPRAEPGTIVDFNDEAITVATGGGLLHLIELQPESRKPQTAREFASGARLIAGERFEPISS